MRKWTSRQAHNLDIVGSSPTPAKKNILKVEEFDPGSEETLAISVTHAS